MKQNFVRLSTRAKTVSLRTLALVMGLVMLLSAVGVGSTLSAFALTNDGSGDQAASLSAAADLGTGIADTATQLKPTLPAYANASLRSDKEDLAGTGADADLSGTGADADLTSTGATTAIVKGSWDNWTEHDCNGTAAFITLDANKTYTFVFQVDGTEYTDSITISGTTDWNFPAKNGSITLQTAAAGTYQFTYNGTSNGSITTHIEFPADTTPTTWTAAGNSTELFGTQWSTGSASDTVNDLTKGSGNDWSKTWSNVRLTKGTIEYKVVKNHAWGTEYPSANAKATVPATGAYNVTVTFNDSTHAVNMTITSASTYSLSVPSNIEDAVVKATFGTKSANEGESITGLYSGDVVTISVTPDTGKICSAVSGTYNSGSSVAATGSGKTWKLTMPGADTTLDVTITPVTLKKIYFNNSYTLYGSVYAYVYNKDGSTESYQYLGKYPGTTMNKLDNSNIWYIEVPQDVEYVQFVSGEGYTTGEMEIPWKNGNTGYDYPKYTAPYGANTTPDIDHGGTWGNYIYGNNNKRTNEYTVSDGTTMSASNLFKGITATMYDYYTDGEIAASAGTASDTGANGAPNGWIKGIGNAEYTWKDGGWSWNPYTTLNSALSAYANNSSQPKYNVSTPLYFGNLNTTNMGDSDKAVVEGYHGWNITANNSTGLNSPNNAVTGLSGKTLANDTIHYYKSGATNENGAPMAMFDEDFLSGENSQNKALASILRTSSFPVRKETVKKLYVDANAFSNWTNKNFYLYVWENSNTSHTAKVEGTVSNNIWTFDVPSDHSYDRVIFYNTDDGKDGGWDNKTDDLIMPSDGNIKYTFTSVTEGKISGTWGKIATSATKNNHTYYEYDSTDGKDNAYIEDISKTNKTAVINYYNNTNKVHSNSDTNGFFPFNRNNLLNSDYAKDLGFGMKLTIPFNLEGSDTANGINEDGTDQTFDFSGDDDLWVFVDDKLVLDLGGAHGRTTGSINFHTKTITANNTQAIGSATRNTSFASGFNTNENYVHTMTIYYMERGMFDSNLKFGFSFHAIPNQFWIDKKIRTKDIINAGFYTSNGQSGNASNGDATMTASEGRFISKFEASYQKEKFNITHKYGSTAAGATDAASGKKYTIDNDTNTYTTPPAGTYPIYHDLGNAFIGQFTTGDYFNLKESFDASNKYVYTPVFSVWDQANNNQAITATGDNTAGYTFHFNPTTSVTTGIENTNIKARFENYMVAHTLTLKKEITNSTDTTSDFTLQIMFDFEGQGNYIAYPLHCDVDGERTQLSNTGSITVKAGQIIEIEEIPENAKIQITEIGISSTSSFTYSNTTLVDADNAVVDPTATVSQGVRFTMGSKDITATVLNDEIAPVLISHTLHPESTGDAFCYVSANVINGSDVKQTYDLTSGVIRVDSNLIKRDSTDNLVITLKANPKVSTSVFQGFFESIVADDDTIQELLQQGIISALTTDTSKLEATITIPISNLFDQTSHKQLYTELPFFSKFGASLMITHKLDMNDSATAALNSAETLVRVEICDAAENSLNPPVYYPGPNATDTTSASDSIVIPPQYFYKNNYTVKVYLTTNLSMNDFSQFNGFWVFDQRIYYGNEVVKGLTKHIIEGNQKNGRVQTVEIDFAMNQLFNEDGSPKVTELPYLSRLYKPEYTYTIKYNYPAYVESYGWQSYTIKGSFTDDQLTNMMKFNADGTLDFKDRDNTNVKKNFVSEHAPYEDNFQKSIIVSDTFTDTHNATSVNFDVNMKYTQGTVSATFSFPYAAVDEADVYSPKVESGKVVKLSENRLNTNSKVFGRSWITTNGVKYDTDGKAPEFVKAPLMIYDGETPLYFQYWSVATVAKYGAIARDYTRCYDPEFNLAIFQDCMITPVYSGVSFADRGMTNPPTAWDGYGRFDPDKSRAYYKENHPENEVTITFLENSRNQYNNGDYGKIAVVDTDGNFISWKNPEERGDTPVSRRGAADRIYSDFLLTFDNIKDENGVTKILKDSYSEGEMECGLVIEGVGQLEKVNDEYVVKQDSYYESADAYKGLTADAIKNYLDNGTALGKSVARSRIDVTQLDNKNRIQYYYGINALKPKSATDFENKPADTILNATDETTGKTLVYKAFAYIGTINGNQLDDVVVCAKPVYFTIYNDASVLPGQSLSY